MKIENADVYVTGSNSKFLSKDVITEFRGRGDVHLPSEEKREQEVRSLKDINDSFKKFVITEDLISRYQDDDGITYMNIYEFLLNEDNL